MANAPIMEDNLTFFNFDISRVIEHGETLAASSGKEFDEEDLSDLDPKERLALQKKRLKERLGMGTQFMDVDFFVEGDVAPIIKKPPKKE